LVVRDQKAFQLFNKDSFQVFSWNFCPTFAADVFGTVARRIHLLAAAAERQTGKKMNRALRRTGDVIT